MILVDTSVWVDHFRRGEKSLAILLEEGSVAVHPLVTEELACGNLSRRDEIFGLLEVLPQAPTVSHAEILGFVSSAGLHGQGVGAVDVHLLASARLGRMPLWSRDKALRSAAQRLRVLASYV